MDEQQMQVARYALEGIKAELDAMAALKGFRFQRMRAFVGAGLNAFAPTPETRPLEFSPETKAALAEIDDNLRNARINSGNFIAGSALPNEKSDAKA